MKIAIMGAVYGDIDLFNVVYEQTGCDLILCTGTIGLFYYKDNCASQRYGYGNFWKYLSGSKKFKCPIVAVPGNKENYRLVSILTSGSIKIDNFKLLSNGEKFVFNKGHEGIGITGLGGGYSPKFYQIPSASKNIRYSGQRYFNSEDITKVKENSETNILLFHELVGPYVGKSIEFHQDMLPVLYDTLALYCFVGRYERWFNSSFPKPFHNLETVSLPKAIDGYGILDTNGFSFISHSIMVKGEKPNNAK